MARFPCNSTALTIPTTLDFATTPQKKLANREIAIVRGKVLGGSSALNLMGVFLAGSVEYDRKFAQSTAPSPGMINSCADIGSLGNPGWSYKTTLHYFRKATHLAVAPKDLQVETHATFDPQFHGVDGVRLCYSHIGAYTNCKSLSNFLSPRGSAR